MNNELTGKSFIGRERGAENDKTFRAFNPNTGAEIESDFYSASRTELERAVNLANEASDVYGNLSGKEKAAFLREIAVEIESLGDDLINRASIETGLPTARFIQERGRTCTQLRLFAELLEEGSWVDARIDSGDAERLPVPKPDVRSMRRPLGAVAVFCAGNFPLAFSVAGGDTVSALAAGCPVIVNAHKSHPGTAELVAQAVSRAIEKCSLPNGVFSLLFSADYEIGQGLVKNPFIKAVGFTGSRRGGQALMAIAAARPVPIPVYAEMSSVNPLFILPEALNEKPASIAEGLHQSFTLGGGQFCTKPGIVIVADSPELQTFTEKLLDLSNKMPPVTLLSPEIQKNYLQGNERIESGAMKESVAENSSGFAVKTKVFQVFSDEFLANPNLSEEIFGPATLIVTARQTSDFIEIAKSFEGQLTATIFGTETELDEYESLVKILEKRAGRIIFNNFPTGVEVCHAMVHGGPFPATSDANSTSVGTRAINRFTRLVCYQNFPQNSLPAELKDTNSLKIMRLQNGELTRENL